MTSGRYVRARPLGARESHQLQSDTKRIRTGPGIPGDGAPALPSQGTNRYLLGIYSDVVNVWQQADGGWWGWGPGLRIRSIIPGSSAQGVFDPNDIIVRVNGDRVRVRAT